MREDCYFYSTWQDMHVIIPYCQYDNDLNNGKSWSICDEDCKNCKQYFPKSLIPNVTDRIIRALVDSDYTTDDYYSLCEDIWHELEELKNKYEKEKNSGQSKENS